jgi:hypothetical protein
MTLHMTIRESISFLSIYTPNKKLAHTDLFIKEGNELATGYYLLVLFL